MTKPRKVPSNMAQRLRQHEHNRMCGNLRMAQTLLHGIANSPACITPVRELAERYALQLHQIEPLIFHWRINVDGTLVNVNHPPKP